MIFHNNHTIEKRGSVQDLPKTQFLSMAKQQIFDGCISSYCISGDVVLVRNKQCSGQEDQEGVDKQIIVYPTFTIIYLLSGECFQ